MARRDSSVADGNTKISSRKQPNRSVSLPLRMIDLLLIDVRGKPGNITPAWRPEAFSFLSQPFVPSPPGALQWTWITQEFSRAP